MQVISVEKLIEAVRKRPVLWDHRVDDFADREMKKEAWLEVWRTMCPNFAEVTEEQRTQMIRDLQLKFKNLRDAYVRYIRNKSDKSKRSKPCKTYIYYKQMSFLNGVIHSRRPRKRWSESELKKEEEEDELTQDDTFDMTEEYLDTPILHDEEEEELVANVDPLISGVVQNNVTENNDDMDFFKSLLPTLQKLKTEQRLKFRIDVMEVLMTYHQAATQSGK